MLYVFWAILNLFLFAGFVVISYYAIKQLRLKYGLFIAFLFTCMLFSFVNRSADNDSSKRKLHHLNFRNNQTSFSFQNESGTWHIEDSLTRHYDLAGNKDFVVYKTPFFNINLHVQYATDHNTKTTVPVFARSSLSGFLAGCDWEPYPPVVNTDEKGENLEYNVSGSMKWKLMNMEIINSEKTFKGSVKIKDE
ncbi:MAG: hypothetical protein EOO10_15075 [Chitinophagaceae bacterium]|nr:MAG: hypothetical protein EOO10_15075 [Chitinophagaceae bacterium]